MNMLSGADDSTHLLDQLLDALNPTQRADHPLIDFVLPFRIGGAPMSTPVHKRTPLHFLVDGLQVWVSYLDAKKDGPFGVVFKWMEDKSSTSPLEHITDDGGYSFKQVENYLMLDGSGIDKATGELETDPAKLNRLQKIWVAYQKRLGETVFSV